MVLHILNWVLFSKSIYTNLSKMSLLNNSFNVEINKTYLNNQTILVIFYWRKNRAQKRWGLTSLNLHVHDALVGRDYLIAHLNTGLYGDAGFLRGNHDIR